MAGSRTLELFRNFVGTWILRRSLGSAGNGSGIAKFCYSEGSEEDVLKYREDLEVTYTGNGGTLTKGTAWKEYIYTYDRRRDKILKSFSDGRHFYELNLTFSPSLEDTEVSEGRENGFSASAEGDHLCEKDFYSASYEFPLDRNQFVLSYDVKGPEKDYVIRSEYLKVTT